MNRRLHKKNENQRSGCPRSLSPSSDTSSSSSSSSSASDTGLSHIELFKKKANLIKANRDALLEKYPRTIWLPNRNDMEWCALCLGSEICSEIYGEQTVGEKARNCWPLPHRRYPLLSIVLHLKQDRVKLVLRYLHQFFLMKGMKNVLCLWIYTLLACLDDRQDDPERDQILDGLYKDCKEYLKNCGGRQKPRVSLLMDIMGEYFVHTLESESE